MTRVQFLHNAPDRLATAAEWLRQASAQRRPVLVLVPDALAAERLDRLLWTQPATGFVPHCDRRSPLAAETPIVLTDTLDEITQDQCLLNLSDRLPDGFSRFEQLIEVVSCDDDVLLPARGRYRHYRERGYSLESRDVSAGL